MSSSSRSAGSAVTSPPSLRYFTDTTEGSTFESQKLRQWTESFLADADRVLNPCAGSARLNLEADVLRVDVNPDADADLNIDFRDLPAHVKPNSFDAIVYDPPYTAHQARTKYGMDLDSDGFYFYDHSVSKLFDSLLAPGGTFIQFGYSTGGMPPDFGYDLQGVALFNKLGSQNDYLGVALEKPGPGSRSRELPQHLSESVKQNAGAVRSGSSGISLGGNGGHALDFSYIWASESPYEGVLRSVVTDEITPEETVLHIYQESPRFDLGERATRCRYNCSELSVDDPESAQFVAPPWDIGSRFATGIFDAVVLDIPYSAFQQTVRAPWKEGRGGSNKTHVHTALKRSITDLVKGETGRVIQIGRTATLMSGLDYDYQRTSVSVIQHPDKDTDRIVSVDKKPHENLDSFGKSFGYYRPDPLPFQLYGIDKPEDGHSRAQCLNCGCHFEHHPAHLEDCLECGAVPGNYCVDENGNPISSIHRDRLEAAHAKHSGDCNEKESSRVEPTDDELAAVLDDLEGRVPETPVEDWLTRAALEKYIRETYPTAATGTSLVDRVLNHFAGDEDPGNNEVNGQQSPTGELSSLSDFS